MTYASLKRLAVSESGFVFDPNTGFTYTLNATAQAILELLKEGLSEEEVVQGIIERFEVDRVRAEKDLLLLLGQLREYELAGSETIGKDS